jgi:hypothetical protein
LLRSQCWQVRLYRPMLQRITTTIIITIMRKRQGVILTQETDSLASAGLFCVRGVEEGFSTGGADRIK